MRIHDGTSDSSSSSSGQLIADDADHLDKHAPNEPIDGPEINLTGSALLSQPMSEVSVTVTEGKNRMVRRILHNCGHSVLQLHRSRYGAITLSGNFIQGKKLSARTAESAELLKKTPASHDRHPTSIKEEVSPLKEGCIRELNKTESDWVNAIMRSIVLQK